jgi:hypothetical protein
MQLIVLFFLLGAFIMTLRIVHFVLKAITPQWAGCLTFTSGCLTLLCVLMMVSCNMCSITPEKKKEYEQRRKEEQVREAEAEKQRIAKQKEKEAEDAEREKGYDVIFMAQEMVKHQLKDADSAQFRDVHYHRGPKNIMVACGWVNSKNSFGGYSGYQRFVSAGTPVLTFLEEEVDDFYKLWNRMCVQDYTKANKEYLKKHPETQN